MSHLPQNAQADSQQGYDNNANKPDGDKNGPYNDSMLQIANIFLTKTASLAFLELQGVNGRKFHLGENIMKQILLPDHNANNQSSGNFAGNILKRIHLQKIFIQPGTTRTYPHLAENPCLCVVFEPWIKTRFSPQNCLKSLRSLLCKHF